MCSILGIPANCAACYHFCTQITKNKNSSFFKRIYTIISFIDVMIGIAQIPIAQTLLLGGFCVISDCEEKVKFCEKKVKYAFQRNRRNKLTPFASFHCFKFLGSIFLMCCNLNWMLMVLIACRERLSRSAVQRGSLLLLLVYCLAAHQTRFLWNLTSFFTSVFV